MVHKSKDCVRLYLSPGLCAVLIGAMLAALGCARLPSEAELASFNNAGPAVVSAVELNEFLRAQVPVGPYRVVPGDLLAVEMPGVLRAIGEPSTENASAVRRRVRPDGALRLPGLDKDLMVKGLTAPEIEPLIEEAYAQAVLKRPAVVVHIADYHKVYVTLAGRGVAQPGQYELRSDELSLSALLMRAGGVSGLGADTITIRPAEGEPLVLPVRDGTVPLQDVVLHGGERVEVAPLAPAVMTIVGQVQAPGRYFIDRANPPVLIDALAHAHGVRETEDPRLVSVYRRDANGNVLKARFRLNGNHGTTKVSLFHDNELGEGAFARVKPGDVVVVERSFRSRARQVLANALHVSVGVSAQGSASYNRDYADDDSTVINTNWP